MRAAPQLPHSILDAAVEGLSKHSHYLAREGGRRAMLFELDQTIQKLRHKHGDGEETVALTGHYHNLLRLWAEL